MEKWEMSLTRAIKLGTSHVSCYGLTYEPSTPLAVRKRLGEFDFVRSPPRTIRVIEEEFL